MNVESIIINNKLSVSAPWSLSNLHFYTFATAREWLGGLGGGAFVGAVGW